RTLELLLHRAEAALESADSVSAQLLGIHLEIRAEESSREQDVAELVLDARAQSWIDGRVRIAGESRLAQRFVELLLLLGQLRRRTADVGPTESGRHRLAAQPVRALQRGQRDRHAGERAVVDFLLAALGLLDRLPVREDLIRRLDLHFAEDVWVSPHELVAHGVRGRREIEPP